MYKFLSMLVVLVVMVVDVTAYTPYENGSNISAIGEPCIEGRTVALNGVPLGSIVIYDGQRFIVEDRVGRDGILDIFMNDYHRAIQFGRKRQQTIEVIIQWVVGKKVVEYTQN